MRYAILSDVHANPHALKAVLNDAKSARVDRLICLGDVVGYGPDAEETVSIVRQEVDVCLMGNHDAAVSAVISGAGFSLHAIQGVKRHRDETSVASRQWLAQLQYVHAEAGFACTHGDFSDPASFKYVSSPADALASWSMRSEPVLFVGHTHAAGAFILGKDQSLAALTPENDLLIESGCRYLINVGSVGYPRRDTDSVYCLYDATSGVIAWRHIDFDYRWYEREMVGQKIQMPAWWKAQKRRKSKWFNWV